MNPISQTESKRKLRVLFTNTNMAHQTGSELYIRDVALAMMKEGHSPIVYSPRLGDLARELRAATIAVVDDLHLIGEPPDLIHGQHHLDAMTAITHFSDTPAVYFCHGWMPWEETPPKHPRILRYVAVSDPARDRLVYEHGISPAQLTMIYNFVDLERFRPRSPLPDAPKRALIFSNLASEEHYGRIVREACARFGISVDIVGMTNGNPTSQPENVLGDYDLVFARGRAAMEALAMGVAVICCDVEGLAAMVTTENLDWLLRNNLGVRVLNRPIQADLIAAEIARYSAADALRVAETIRTRSSFATAYRQILNVYDDVLNCWQTAKTADAEAEGRAVADYLHFLSDSVPHRLGRQLHDLSVRYEQLAGENEMLKALVAQHRNAPVIQPVALPAQDGAAHPARALYHALVPLRVRLIARDARKAGIRLVRPAYRTLVPLSVRLRLRDARMTLLRG